MKNTRIYKVTVIDIEDDDTMDFYFTNADEKDEFINALEHYTDIAERKFEYVEDDFQSNTLEGAKKDVKNFLVID